MNFFQLLELNESDIDLLEFGNFYNEKLDRIIPFQLKTPDSYAGDLIAKIGLRGAQIIVNSFNCVRKTVHVVGIERGGVPVAVAIAIQLRALNYKVTLHFDSSFSRSEFMIKEDDLIVLIDNSLITGKTMNASIEIILSGIRRSPNMALYLFDHLTVNHLGESVPNSLERKFGILVKSIYCLTDFLDFLPENKRVAINEYLDKYRCKL